MTDNYITHQLLFPNQLGLPDNEPLSKWQWELQINEFGGW